MMGVDCAIRLPADTRVMDVAEVIGILLGQPKSWHIESDWVRWVVVEEVEVRVSNVPHAPECAQVSLPQHSFLYHFEGEGGTRLLLLRSTPENLALGKALVEFFGGELDFQDSDDTQVDFSASRPRPRNDPRSGKEWAKFQNEKFSLCPLTSTDIKAMRPHAAYAKERGEQAVPRP